MDLTMARRPKGNYEAYINHAHSFAPLSPITITYECHAINLEKKIKHFFNNRLLDLPV